MTSTGPIWLQNKFCLLQLVSSHNIVDIDE